MEKIGHNTKSQAKWKALLCLLDDESPVVRKGILDECDAHPVEAKEFLHNISQGEDPLLARHAQDLVRDLGWIDGVGDFVRFIRSQRYELETGWFLLDRTVYPSFQSSSSTLFMDKLARRTRELLTPPMSARQICSTLNRVLFHEYGFRGAGKDFENPENSFLHRVIERRQGLPITLSVLFILLARRIGLELEPIGLPGRFVVGCFEDERPFYLDAWAGGKILDGVGFGLKWGPQYSGGELIIHLLDFTDTKGTQSPNSLTIHTSKIKATQVKYRHYLPVIVDEFTGLALFASVGQFFGDFIRRRYVDGGAVTAYSMRHVSGNLIDFGVSICYKLNPDWALNMHVLYQYSMQEKTTNPVHSAVNDVSFDYTGAEFALATSIKL